MDESITPRRFAETLAHDIPKHWLPGNEVVSGRQGSYCSAQHRRESEGA